MTQVSGMGMNVNLITEVLEDIRTKTGAFHFLRVETKILQDIEWNNDKKVYQYDKTLDVSWNSRVLYRVMGQNSIIFFDGNNPPANKPPFVNGLPNPDIP
jgi:hypothetical protein